MTHATQSQPSNTIAGIFGSEKDARRAIKELHKAGFKKTWIATIRPADRESGEPTIDNPNPLDRLLSGGTDRRPLTSALIERGLTEAQAQNVERDIAVGNTILTAYGEADPQTAAQCIANAGGEVIDAGGTVPAAYHRSSADQRTVPVQRGDTADDAADDVSNYEYEEFFVTGRL